MWKESSWKELDEVASGSRVEYLWNGSVGRLSNWFSAVWAIHEPHHKVYLNKVCNSFCGPELT
jgi:hypothetical protein